IPGFSEFVDQIKRRKTGRVALIYVAAAFFVLVAVNQVAYALPGGEGGAWHVAIILATAAGIPVALVLSWVFDITAPGLRREPPLPGDAVAEQSMLRANWLPIAAIGLSVLVFVVLWWAIARRLGWI